MNERQQRETKETLIDIQERLKDKIAKGQLNEHVLANELFAVLTALQELLDNPPPSERELPAWVTDDAAQIPYDKIPRSIARTAQIPHPPQLPEWVVNELAVVPHHKIDTAIARMADMPELPALPEWVVNDAEEIPFHKLPPTIVPPTANREDES